MSGNESIRVLIAEIDKHCRVLQEIRGEIGQAVEQDVKVLGKTKRTAAMVAALLESYYTCAETIFLRISQFFENSLSDNRWHTDLLDKMTLEVPEIRPRVLSDAAYRDLEELLRFRHFKRYYFALSYDWERLDEVVRRATRVHEIVRSDLSTFVVFLKQLLQDE